MGISLKSTNIISIVEGVSSEEIESKSLYIEGADSNSVDNFVLNTLKSLKKFADKYKYIYFRSTYPVKFRILGAGEIESYFLEISLTKSANIEFTYINPGEDQDNKIFIILLRD